MIDGKGGVPDLSQQRHVVVVERRILSPASCEVRDGGVTIGGCDQHLEVIDIATGKMYLIPITRRQASAIHGGLITG